MTIRIRRLLHRLQRRHHRMSLPLTGSIGIFGMFPNAKGLTDKIGVNFDVVKTNKYADFGMLTRPMNDGEKGLMQMYVNNGYELF